MEFGGSMFFTDYSTTSAGVVSADEAATWIDELRRAAATSQFWCAVTVFTVSGRRE
jgi:hypothetical protein